MKLYVFIALIGFSLVCLGVAVARVIATVRRTSMHFDKSVTDPVLIDGWDLPSEGVPPDAVSSALKSPAPR